MFNKKFLLIFILVSLVLINGCVQQLSGGVNKTRCENIIESKLIEGKIVELDKITLLKQKNFGEIKSLYPELQEGNGGINPLMGYYFTYDDEEDEYYLIKKQFYSETWFGPYKGSYLGTGCVPQL